MTEQSTRQVRYRVTVSRGMKGAFSYEATCEVTDNGDSGDDTLVWRQVLRESDELMAELAERYPLQEAVK